MYAGKRWKYFLIGLNLDVWFCAGFERWEKLWSLSLVKLEESKWDFFLQWKKDQKQVFADRDMKLGGLSE